MKCKKCKSENLEQHLGELEHNTYYICMNCGNYNYYP